MERTSGFVDERLQRRLETITHTIEKAPSISFPQMCDSSELEAMYRFFGNAKVNPEAILASHYDEVRSKAASAGTVLVLHDTTKFKFNSDDEDDGRPTEFWAHFSLVVGAQAHRHPLGLCNLFTWRRDQEKVDEYARWFDCAERSAERLPEAVPIHIMDREADDYMLFARLHSGGHRFIVRLAHQNRRLVDDGMGRLLQDALSHVECSVERKAKLSKRANGKRLPRERKIHPSRKQRTAKLSIGAVSVTFKRPKPHPRDTQRRRIAVPDSVPVNVVRVWEDDPPEGETEVEWLLVTSEPVSTEQELLQVVDSYRARWTIEEYFKAIKTGCAYEKRQLGDYEGLCNALATLAPIACRAIALRSIARSAPDGTTKVLLGPDEVEVLRRGGRRELPREPTNQDLLYAVAALGGHIKWNGPPGWLTILRGLQRLETLTVGWRLAKLQQLRDQ